ncbi:equatorin isoform X1 [Rousettus aegyptiacus]|uniref:equatorin isoform X1 n=1 Tax=Rousettus aegyptiacus TaxID=9407 RepID=UPI00168CAD58|nr:equatorin isoform X1 [Rousettus aegyptiacus]
MPISKKSKPFRGFKYQNVDERIQIMSPEERNLQISGTDEEEIDKTQVTIQVPTSKEIISPFRGPVSSPVSHTELLRTQQQAVQITAAHFGIKEEYICMSQTQRKVSGENSLVSNNLHLDVVLSKEVPTANPSRSHILVKSIAFFPAKVL